MKDNTLIVVCIVLCLFIASVFLGFKINKPITTRDIIEVRTDTIVMTDTIIKPIPITVREIRTDTIIGKNDTIYLPIEQKSYTHTIDNDTVKGSIKAVYSGYNAVLDTLQYDLQITNKTLYKRRKLGFTIGVSSGIGYDFNNKVTPYIGLGVTYGFNF